MLEKIAKIALDGWSSHFIQLSPFNKLLFLLKFFNKIWSILGYAIYVTMKFIYLKEKKTYLGFTFCSLFLNYFPLFCFLIQCLFSPRFDPYSFYQFFLYVISNNYIKFGWTYMSCLNFEHLFNHVYLHLVSKTTNQTESDSLWKAMFWIVNTNISKITNLQLVHPTSLNV